MQGIDNFENVFGKADRNFEENVYRTLTKLINDEKRHPARKPLLRMAVIAAVISTFLVGTATALALTNAWGIMDFFRSGSENSPVLPEAAEIVQQNPPQEGGIVAIVQPEQIEDEAIEVENVQFTIREAVFDGTNVYLVIEAKPTSPDYLILALDAEESDYINAGINTVGKTFIRAFVRVPASTGGGDFVIENDGTFVFMWYFPYEDDSSEITLELICGVLIDDYDDMEFVDLEELQATLTVEEYNEFVAELRRQEEDRVAGNNQSDRIESTLLVTVQNTGANVVRSIDSVYFNESGIRIDSVTLIGSEMSTNVRIEYTVIDDALHWSLFDELGFEAIDENNNVIISGISAGGGMASVNGNETNIVTEFSIRAFETMPREITLRAFNIFGKEHYDTHSFELR